MLKELLLYSGSVVIVVWGIAHIVIPTKGVVASFEPMSKDNRYTLLMEWIMEGLTLCFLGLLVTVVSLLSAVDNPTSDIVYRAAGLMLLAMAGVSLFTGAKTTIVPMKLCPPIFTIVAIAYWVATFI